MAEFFTEYKAFILFIHVISAVIWVGGMIAMRYAAHPSFMQIESPLKRLEHISKALKKLFIIVLPFVVLLFISAFVMIKAYSLSASEYAVLAHAKEAIWSVMFINLIVMITAWIYWKVSSSGKYFLRYYRYIFRLISF